MRFFPLGDDIFKPSIYDWVFMENGGLGDKTGMQRGGRATERRVAFGDEDCEDEGGGQLSGRGQLRSGGDGESEGTEWPRLGHPQMGSSG